MVVLCFVMRPSTFCMIGQPISIIVIHLRHIKISIKLYLFNPNQHYVLRALRLTFSYIFSESSCNRILQHNPHYCSLGYVCTSTANVCKLVIVKLSNCRTLTKKLIFKLDVRKTNLFFCYQVRSLLLAHTVLYLFSACSIQLQLEPFIVLLHKHLKCLLTLLQYSKII